MDVDEPVVGADFEVLHRLLVDVRAADDAEAADAGGQRDGSADPGAGALGGLGDLLRGCIQVARIVAAQPDADGEVHKTVSGGGGCSGSGCLAAARAGVGVTRGSW